MAAFSTQVIAGTWFDVGELLPLAQLPNLGTSAHLVETWLLSSGGPVVALYEKGCELWIHCESYGAVCFSPGEQGKAARFYKNESISLSLFRHIALHYWLPLIYNGWGYLVLHASAVCHLQSGAVFLFVGDSGAGKSTWAYGLCQRPGWVQLTDDAFAIDTQHQRVEPIYLPGASRLRPESATHFNAPLSEELHPWPTCQLSLGGIYCLRPDIGAEELHHISSMTPAQTCTKLLSQSFVLHVDWPAIRSALVRDVLFVTKRIPAFQLTYRPSFDQLSGAIAFVAEHMCSL